MGTMQHQDAVTTLVRLLRLLRESENAGWGIGSQIAILGLSQPDGGPYTALPDVFIHHRPIPHDITAIILAAYGPPWLIVEVASATSVLADLGEKAHAYARGGVREYLVFDPGDRLLPERVWARRLSPQSVAPWEPEADGRWRSAQASLGLGPDGPLLRVYDRAGRPVPTEAEERQRAREDRQRRRQAEWQVQQEAQRRQEAEQRAQDAERRLADLEAQLRRGRGA